MKKILKNKSLLTGTSLALSAVLFLSGCETASSWMGMERKGQAISGGRRVPLNNASHYNPVEKKPEAAMHEAAPGQVKNSAVNKEMNPYDQYDSNGNQTASDDSDSNFFTDMFKQAPAYVTASEAKNEQVTDVYSVRKALPGNPPLKIAATMPALKPFVAPRQISAAPEAPAFIREATAEPVKSEASLPEHVIAQAPLINKPLLSELPSSEATEPEFIIAAAPVETRPVPAELPKAEISEPEYIIAAVGKETNNQQNIIAQEDKPLAVQEAKGPVIEHSEITIVSNEGSIDASVPQTETLFGRMGAIFDDKKSQSSEAYPEISSVPQKPGAFETIRKDRQENLDNLENEQQSAQQQRQYIENQVDGQTAPPIPSFNDIVKTPIAKSPTTKSAPLLKEVNVQASTGKDDSEAQGDLASDLPSPEIIKKLPPSHYESRSKQDSSQF